MSLTFSPRERTRLHSCKIYSWYRIEMTISRRWNLSKKKMSKKKMTIMKMYGKVGPPCTSKAHKITKKSLAEL